MKYRPLDENDDYVFGTATKFLADSPEAVAQAIKTRLRMLAGQWFVNTAEGLDATKILGVNTQGTRDLEVQNRILRTQGVKSLVSYSSSVDPNRHFTVTAEVETDYGNITITETL